LLHTASKVVMYYLHLVLTSLLTLCYVFSTYTLLCLLYLHSVMSSSLLTLCNVFSTYTLLCLLYLHSVMSSLLTLCYVFFLLRKPKTNQVKVNQAQSRNLRRKCIIMAAGRGGTMSAALGTG